MVAFSEGMLAVCDKITEKWGFVDKTGEEVISCKYDYVSWSHPDVKNSGLFDPVRPFHNGLAKVRIGTGEGAKWVNIDKKGNEWRG